MGGAPMMSSNRSSNHSATSCPRAKNRGRSRRCFARKSPPFSATSASRQPAIPQLMELLEDGVPDGIREAAAGARQDRQGIARRHRPTDPGAAVHHPHRPGRPHRPALGDIGCADARVKTALVNLWLVHPFAQQSGPGCHRPVQAPHRRARPVEIPDRHPRRQPRYLAAQVGGGVARLVQQK